jgi:hypothetical protein
VEVFDRASTRVLNHLKKEFNFQNFCEEGGEHFGFVNAENGLSSRIWNIPASSGCGWRGGLQISWVASNILNKQ